MGSGWNRIHQDAFFPTMRPLKRLGQISCSGSGPCPGFRCCCWLAVSTFFLSSPPRPRPCPLMPPRTWSEVWALMRSRLNPVDRVTPYCVTSGPAVSDAEEGTVWRGHFLPSSSCKVGWGLSTLEVSCLQGPHLLWGWFVGTSDPRLHRLC